MLYPSQIEQKIGFDKIRELLRQYCLSGLGVKQVNELSFSDSFTEIEHNIALSAEFKQVYQFEDTFPDNNYVDLSECLARIRIEGAWIQLQEIVDLRRSLAAIYSIVAFFRGKEEGLYPRLRQLAGSVEVHKIIVDRIDSILDRNGKIKDNATPELANIRRQISVKRSEVSKIMQRLLKEAKSEGWAETDTELSIRDGRLVIPVNASAKRRMGGFVHDESATGKTSYVEPAEAFEKNNQVTELEFEEHREIVKILTSFTDFVRPYREDLIAAYYFLGTIDFLRAKAKLAVEMEAVAPKLFDEQVIRLEKARHPLLYLSHQREGKPVVDQRVDLSPKQRILLISGPNAGGKSVCLKMVGILQYMLQCGLLIPVGESTECGVFDNIFIDIGDEQSIENDLSTYSSHLKNMKFFVDNAGSRTIVLIDEFGAGTEPMLGGAIAEAVLDRLHSLGCFGVINTHYTNLKHFATQTEGIVNGAMLFDSENMRPLFKLRMGTPGSSFAFEIAENMGLPKDLLLKATEKVGIKHVDFDKTLKEVEREKQYLFNKRQEMDEKEAHLRQVLDKYNTKLEEINKKKKEILDNAHSEAKILLDGSNKIIENTIRQIKESSADKEKTKVARQELEAFKVQTEDKRQIEDERILKKIEHIQQKQVRRQQKHVNQQSQDGIPKPKKAAVQILDPVIREGDTVRIAGQHMPGEVSEIEGKNVIVSFGQLRTHTKLEKLQKISEADFKRLTHNPEANRVRSNVNAEIREKRLHFKPEIDVRVKRSEESMKFVMEFVEKDNVLGITQIQVLHGKGNGILRSQIRTYLKTVNVVKNFSDAHIDMGGAGITVIEIE